ncbi:phytoene/squalene synthase family protein [Actinokineospora soli]
MSGRELDAAGVTDPRLRAAYAHCRRLNARHGRTYFLATRLLPPSRRPAVHALYGFARHVDDLVDEPRGPVASTLDTHARALHDGLDGRGTTTPVITAVVDTARRYRIDRRLFDAFLRSMRMDLTLTDYPTRADLKVYIHGSARVIGLQMLPVLGTPTPAEAAPHAAALGEAFQLTNFLRDIPEDLDRGRVYLPADELATFDVDRDRLLHCRTTGHADPAVRAAIAAQIATTREVYHHAAQGIPMLDPASRPCIEAALTLYANILDRIEAMNHNVFAGRAAVGNTTRARVAGTAYLRARRARAGFDVRSLVPVQEP